MESQAWKAPDRVAGRSLAGRFGVAIAVLGALSACQAMPRTLTEEILLTQVGVHAEQNRAEIGAALESIAQRIALKHAQGRTLESGEIPVDILALSGGGEKGAFGAGFLIGWGDASGVSLTRPRFDVVTGVSTGSLIAPFAALGRDEDYENVESVYRAVEPSFAQLQGKLFFLPWKESFFDTGELASLVRDRIDTDVIGGLSEAHDRHSVLLIGTVDADLGRFHVWNVGWHLAQQPRAPETFVEDVLLASCAIPAAFPPVKLEGRLHVDGCTAEMLFFATNAEALRRIVSRARELGIGDTPVVFRMWVIVNGQLALEPEVVSRTWVSLALRSISVQFNSAALSALQRLALVRDAVNADHADGLRCEFRYVAIPDAADIPESEVIFDSEVTQYLADMGRDLGGREDVWRSDAPRYLDR